MAIQEKILRTRATSEDPHIEFGPVLHYIKVEDNIVADNLSRLGKLHDDSNTAENRYDHGGPNKNQEQECKSETETHLAIRRTRGKNRAAKTKPLTLSGPT